ncbi:hypothetical protein EJ08DRAFT_27182 [Tothia fuscella]|uniref:Uncharacterized protein n=1 Tax=Tothia fuscella TaxID=1048955 RepID=A0A9P4TTG8_9PEZI|nr:hypothetical protein EJ08DRAFT_27182 [Tothia fuscella]
MFRPLAHYYSKHLDLWIQRTGGIVRFTKQEFYGLFKVALLESFTVSNIQSAWLQSGLYPFDPAVVLDKTKPEEDRPTTSSSRSSASTVYSVSNMPKVRQLLKRAHGLELTGSQIALANFVVKIASSNSILKARAEGAEGAEEALYIEQERRKRGKAVWKVTKVKDIEGKAQFYTPARVTARIDANKAAEVFKETKAFRKAQEKSDKQRQKED